MAMPRLKRETVDILGARFPVVVVALVGLTVALSVIGAMGWRNGVRVVLERGALVPGLVWAGQIWRLFTWTFFELDPLSLIFWAMIMLFFGRELYYVWGRRRFVALYVGISAAAGAVTSVAAYFWPAVLSQSYISAWPLAEAFTVAWAVLFPSRQILLYFVLPVGGRTLLYLTVGGVLLFALMQGFAPYLPHFTAMLLMLAYLGEFNLRTSWLRLRYWTVSHSLRRRASHLKVVGKEEDRHSRWVH
jgi:membrane associated rhomboid family serine protease